MNQRRDKVREANFLLENGEAKLRSKDKRAWNFPANDKEGKKSKRR